MQSLDRSSAIYATSYLPYLDLSHNASFPLFNYLQIHCAACGFEEEEISRGALAAFYDKV